MWTTNQARSLRFEDRVDVRSWSWYWPVIFLWQDANWKGLGMTGSEEATFILDIEFRTFVWRASPSRKLPTWPISDRNNLVLGQTIEKQLRTIRQIFSMNMPEVQGWWWFKIINLPIAGIFCCILIESRSEFYNLLNCRSWLVFSLLLPCLL